MNIRNMHFPSVGVMGLLMGGLLTIFAPVFQWPLVVVILSRVVLLIAVGWIVLFDLLPLFLPPFYFLRKRFSRRRSFFVALLLLFIILRTTINYVPSGPTRDIMGTLAFISFISAVVWFVVAYVVSQFTPLIKYMKRKPRDAERVTFSDIITSLAIIFAPTIVLSFVFSPTGLKEVLVTPYQVFVSSLLTDICMIVYLFLYIIRPRVFTLKQLGLRKVDKEDITEAMGLFLAVSLFIIVLQSVLAQFGVRPEAYSFSTTDGAFFALFATVVLNPFIQELYFRGFLFRGLLLHNRPAVAYFISTLLFALLHPPLTVMIEVFIVGILLAYVAKQTKSIWPGVLIHTVNNAFIMWYLLF
jgi:membrane protease YdiL (CAAX protease family)